MDAEDLTLRHLPFQLLMEANPALAELRSKYANKPAKARRNAAEWSYDSSIARSIFDAAVSSFDPDREAFPIEMQGVAALAIDPTFAPALLTVGSTEYQLGREEAAMELFLTLTTLPPTEPDLVEIVDKAGDFLLDSDDPENALRLYEAAAASAPDTALYWSCVGYCLDKLERRQPAIEAYRRAIELDPTDHRWSNDLGWTLANDGRLEEARELLLRAIELSGGDDELPRENLRIVERQIREGANRTSGGS